ncbi:MAG TPA: hypothetical protein VM261_34335 [Kofleriaceae bacterium]|nr:hypothetical protein [Kofleriaceae bacterium]
MSAQHERDLFPDLPGESRSDCARCPLAREHVEAPWPWRLDDDGRCCTYHPTLFNFRAGRALARGGESAALVLARIARRDGVTRLGIGPPAGWIERYDGGTAFGRDASLRCPYWVGGAHTCGIWADRPAVCRAWFCRHDHGFEAASTWSQLGDAVGDAEEALARRLCDQGAPPDADRADASEWADWFRWCAERATILADGAPPDPDERVLAHRDALVRIRSGARPALPDRLVPSVSAMWRAPAPADERVLLAGYSTFDAIDLPASVFTFLSRLDGATAWRDALAGVQGVDEDVVRELYRTGVIRAA